MVRELLFVEPAVGVGGAAVVGGECSVEVAIESFELCGEVGGIIAEWSFGVGGSVAALPHLAEWGADEDSDAGDDLGEARGDGDR
jgi:hypothetical protein